MSFKKTEIGYFPNTWKIDTMENALESIIDYRGKTPEKAETGILTLSARSVKNGYIDYSNAYCISPSEYRKFMVRGKPRIGDILMTTEAPIGCIAKLDRDDIGLAQRLLTLRGEEGYVGNDYLMYYLISKVGQHQLNSRSSGTTVTGIKQSEFRKTLIVIPPIHEQKVISGTLSCLDKKIELNKRINDNLAEEAQAIYQNWFVNFEPFSEQRFFITKEGEIPLGWQVGQLSDLVNVRYGKDHKKLSEGSIPVYGSGGIMRYVERALYDLESVLIPRKGSLGNVIYINEPFWSVDTMFFTEMKFPNIAKYIYHFTKEKDLVSMNAGSAVPSMTTEILNNLAIVIPPKDVLQQFENVISPLYVKMAENTKENAALSETRDALLPKLMSGEIDVSEISN